MAKRVSPTILIFGYLPGGINHFLHRAGYIVSFRIIFRSQYLLIICQGWSKYCLEHFLFWILPAVLQHRYSLMLIAFLPVHILMVIDAALNHGTFTISPRVAW